MNKDRRTLNYGDMVCGDLPEYVAVAKPKLNASGLDGNIFAVVGSAERVLPRTAEGKKQRKEMRDRVCKAGSYDEALQIVMEYVEFIFADECKCRECGIVCDDLEDGVCTECYEEDEDEEELCVHCGAQLTLKDGYCIGCYDLYKEEES